MISLVDHVEVERINGAGRPEAQRIDVPSAPANDRRVVRNRLDGFAAMPERLRATFCRSGLLHPTAELDVVDHLRALKFPRVGERQPLFRMFLLPAVPDDLLKQPVIIADAVAIGRDPKARHALDKAGGEASQTAVAERSVGFGT